MLSLKGDKEEKVQGEMFFNDTSRNAKQVVHKNNMEWTAYKKKRHHLSREHASKQTEIAREEKEMKDTLVRLHDEQAAFSHLDVLHGKQ